MTNHATGNQKAVAHTGVGRDEDGSPIMDRYSDSALTIARAHLRHAHTKLFLTLAVILVVSLTGLAPTAGAGTTRLYQGPLGSSSKGEKGSVAVDQLNGDIYVVSNEASPRRITRYDSSGAPKNFIAGPNAGTNALTVTADSVNGVAVDNSGGPLDGHLYVSEATGGGGTEVTRVRVFDRTGESLGTITGAGTPRGLFDQARAITVDQSDGSLYVFSRENFVTTLWHYAPNSPSGTVDDSDYVVTGVKEIPLDSGGNSSIAVGMGAVYVAGGVLSESEGEPVVKVETSAFAANVPKAPTSIVESESQPVRARAVAVDPETGELYAGERDRVAVFSPDGTFLYRFGAIVYFSEFLEGLAVKSAASGSAEKVYISQPSFANKEVAVFGPAKPAVVRARLPLGSFGKDGSATSTVGFNIALAFSDSPASIFVYDAGAPGIYGFDASALPPMSQFPAFSPLSTSATGFQPGLAVDNTALSSAGNVYLASSGLATSAPVKLYGFDSSGAPLAGFPVDPATTPGAPGGSPKELHGVAVDSEGHVWVVNSATKRVLEYSSAGAYLGSVDVSAQGKTPTWIAFDSSDNMFVSMSGSGVWKYPAPSYASPLQVESDKRREQMGIAVNPATDELYVAYQRRVDIYAPSGELLDEIRVIKANENTYRGITVDPVTGNIYLYDEVTQQIRIISRALVLPEPALGTASDLSDVTATLSGRVGAQTVPIDDCQFQYVSEEAFRVAGFDDLDSGGSVSCGSVPTDLEDHEVSASISGLVPNTTYRFRITATNENGTVTTPDASFTTLGPPLAETTGSPRRTMTTAWLEGRISPSNAPASFHFEYGTQGPCDSSPCASTEAVSAGSGGSYALASTRVSGLQPGTTYHYRLVADNGQPGSPTYGEDMTVTTRSSDAPLSHGHFTGPPGSDRAYEQVNLADTGGNPVASGVAFSDNGDRALYYTSGGNPSSPTGGFLSLFFAQREEGSSHTGGWQSRSVMPPRDELVGANFRLPNGPRDLSSFTVANFIHSNPNESVWQLFPEQPAQKLFESSPPQEIEWYVGADSSNRMVMAIKGGAIDPDYPAAASVTNLYDVTDGSAKLASLLPGNVPPSCGVEVSGAFGFGGAPVGLNAGLNSMNWLSADGERLFFASRGSSCGDSPALYMRELDAEETKPVSGSPLSGDSCGAALIKSTADAVFFWTASRLASEDTNPGNCTGKADGDVYRYEIASEALECLTCLVASLDADVFAGSGNAGDAASNIAVAEDGSRIYFQSPSRLLPGTPPSQTAGSVYRLNLASGDLRWIAGPGARAGDLASQGGGEAALSPDGSILVFRAKDPSLNPLGGGADNGGKFQYYLYDDTDRSLTCVSCPPDGSAASTEVQQGVFDAAVQPSGANVTPLAADGTFAFKATEALVNADQNTAGTGQDPLVGTDLYEYRDGRALLLTDGLTNWPAGEVPSLAGVSPSGRDIFFTAPIQYTQDALDGYRRLYDARIGGGFEFPPPPKPCPLEVCQGTPKGAPEEQAPGTGTYVGPGNALPQPTARKHKKKPRAKKHKKKQHKKAQRKQRAGNDGRNAR